MSTVQLGFFGSSLAAGVSPAALRRRRLSRSAAVSLASRRFWSGLFALGSWAKRASGCNRWKPGAPIQRRARRPSMRRGGDTRRKLVAPTPPIAPRPGGIDGTSEADGIEIALATLGPDFPAGLMVAQDGDNAPEAQNFKLVPWPAVARLR